MLVRQSKRRQVHRWPQDGPKVAPRRLQEGAGWPQDGPRGCQHRTQVVARAPQDAPEKAQDEDKMAQHRASQASLKVERPNSKNIKRLNNNNDFGGSVPPGFERDGVPPGFKRDGVGFWVTMAQDGPKMAQDAPKMAPRWPQDGPKKQQNGGFACAPCKFC